MILKPHQINGPLKPHSPASTIPHTQTKDAHQPFQQQQPSNDIFKVFSAKKAGNGFIKNLNLSESLYPHKISTKIKDSDPEEDQNLLNKTSETHVSDLVFPRYTFSGTKASNKLMKIITSPSPDRKESNPLSLDLKKLLNPREIRKSQNTSKFPNIVNKIEKKSKPDISVNTNKSQWKEETQSFAFSDFDEFVEALSQPSRYSKVHHVQDLVHKIKPSYEYSRDSAFKKHSRSVSPNEGSFSRSRVDQQYLDFINMKKRDNGGRTRSTTEEKARKSSNVLTNKSVFPSFDNSPTRMGHTMTPGDISGEKNPQSFEEFLNDHGVGISLFSHNMTAETPAPTKILTINEGIHHFSQHTQQPQQPGILNELTTDSKISQAHNNGVFVSSESQNNDMLASLQFFLRENLKEMGEIKNILREQGSPTNKSPEEQSHFLLKPHILEKDEVVDGDDKLQRELIRFANRIQELEKENASLQQSTQANTNNTNTKIINQGGLKSGNVKISQIIKSEVNIQSATLEEILEDFELKEKYLMVASDQITISENIDTESNQDEVRIERIEYITSFEKSGSYYFVIKLGQITREKSRSLNSRSTKPSPFENKNGSYLIELIDKKEAADWETVFFFINFKALARKGNLQQNKSDFINSLKLFLSRYADCNGDNVLIFGDTFHVHSEKQNLNPSLSNISKHSQSFDPIPEILHETSQTTEHEPIEIPEAEDVETNKKMTLQLQPIEPESGSKQSIPAAQRSRSAQEEEDDELDQVIRERDSEDEEDGEDAENEMMEDENNVQEEMIFSIGDEALALEDNKNSSIYHDTIRETGSKENQEFSKNLTSLLEGFTLEKYGKWGTKREKLVRVSNDFTGLEWRDLKKPKRLPDSISVDFIERVEVAGRSSYFQKKKMADGELNLCVSVISTEREVNLKAPDLKTRENFVSSLQFILNERVKLQKLATHIKSEKDRDLKREKY